jgi:hypothetical protein
MPLSTVRDIQRCENGTYQETPDHRLVQVNPESGFVIESQGSPVYAAHNQALQERDAASRQASQDKATALGAAQLERQAAHLTLQENQQQASTAIARQQTNEDELRQNANQRLQAAPSHASAAQETTREDYTRKRAEADAEAQGKVQAAQNEHDAQISQKKAELGKAQQTLEEKKAEKRLKVGY